MRRQKLISAAAIADRRHTDRLERHTTGVYLVDTTGAYAPVKVKDDEAAGWPLFQANTLKLTRAEDINRAFLAVSLTADLTEEGRAMRLAALRSQWKARFGDAQFVVDE